MTCPHQIPPFWCRQSCLCSITRYRPPPLFNPCTRCTPAPVSQARGQKAAQSRVQSRQLQKPKPVVPAHRILRAPVCRDQNQWLHCAMSSAGFTVLFLTVSVAQYNPFCLTVSPESSAAAQTRHLDTSRPGGFSCFSPGSRRGASFHFNYRSEELDTNLIDHRAATAGYSRR